MRRDGIIGMLVLGALVGCGSGGSNGMIGSGGSGGSSGAGGSGGTPTFMTTVPASIPLGQLTQEQFVTMCSELNSYRNALAQDTSFRPVECKFFGIATAALNVGPNATDAQVQQACSTAANSCASAPPQPSTLPCQVRVPNTCTATVAQYAACLNDSVATDEAAVDSIPSCGALTVATARDIATMPGTPTLPASCATFAAACPATYGFGDVPSPAISPSETLPNP